MLAELLGPLAFFFLLCLVVLLVPCEIIYSDSRRKNISLIRTKECKTFQVVIKSSTILSQGGPKDFVKRYIGSILSIGLEI